MIEIDFKLLLAQIVTFLVAVFILWRFFWGPLTKMIEKRRSAIREDIEGAKKGREEVEKAKLEYQERISQIEDEAKRMLEAAMADGRQAREEILRSAQEQAKGFLQNAKDEIVAEKELAMKELRKETVGLAVLMAEKVLKQSLDRGTQERLLQEFVEELKHE